MWKIQILKIDPGVISNLVQLLENGKISHFVPHLHPQEMSLTHVLRWVPKEPRQNSAISPLFWKRENFQIFPIAPPLRNDSDTCPSGTVLPFLLLTFFSQKENFPNFLRGSAPPPLIGASIDLSFIRLVDHFDVLFFWTLGEKISSYLKWFASLPLLTFQTATCHYGAPWDGP